MPRSDKDNEFGNHNTIGDYVQNYIEIWHIYQKLQKLGNNIDKCLLSHVKIDQKIPWCDKENEVGKNHKIVRQNNFQTRFEF